MISMENMVLAPRPQSITGMLGGLMLQSGAKICMEASPYEIFPIARRLQESVWNMQHVRWTLYAGKSDRPMVQAVLKIVSPKIVPAQGYRLSITPEKLQLLGSDCSGLFYGVMTLTQMLRQNEGSLPAGEIEDYPDYAVRGVLLDVSRGKVPTMETLYEIIDQLAGLKVNHLELYTEHTFAYQEHREAWAEASPISGEDVLCLDQYCRQRYVDLVPNQNSLGHMNRWLELPRYNHLAECPEGCSFPNGYVSGPYGLNPLDVQSLYFIEGLYAELLPHFSSRKFNIGGDEAFDLGQGASKAACELRGQGRIYLDYLLKLYELVKKNDRKMHFWGDIIINHPELVSELPKDVVVLEWGYEADHPFDEHGAKFAQAGIRHYVCPGTSAWSSFAGRTDNCLVNLRNAACNGLKHGAVGYLNTDWGDNGHLQYLPASYFGFTAGASLSWCYKANCSNDFVDALNVHVFRDAAGVMGKLVYDLGNAYQKPGHLISNGSILDQIMTKTTKPIPDSVKAESLQFTQTYIEEVMKPLHTARMNRPDADIVEREYANTALLMLHACQRGICLKNNSLSNVETSRQLASAIRMIMGEHRELWMARNRAGGIQDSTGILVNLLNEYKK